MSQILLISVNDYVDPYPVFPLGMATVAASLQESGHEVHQFDFLVEDKSIKKLNQQITVIDPDFIGISIRNIDKVDSFSSPETWQLARIKNLIDEIRKVSVAPIICGGAGFSIMPETLVNYLGADYGVQGQGEGVINHLIEALTAGREVPQIVRCADFGVQPDQISPLLDERLVRYYFERSGFFNLQTKRGCSFRCLYCSYPTIEGRTFRSKEVGRVIEDIKKTMRDFGIREFFFTDSIFNDPLRLHMQLVEAILEEGLDIRWGAFFTPRKQSLSDLELMQRSGLIAVELGTDATTDVTLKGLNKGFTFEEVEFFNNCCVQIKMPCAHYVLFGGPDETMDTVKQGVENMLSLQSCVVLGFSGIRIFPDTPLYKRAIDDGVIEKDNPLIEPVFYISPDVDYEKMNNFITEAFKRRPDRIFPPSKGQKAIELMKQLGATGILWDKLIRF